MPLLGLILEFDTTMSNERIERIKLSYLAEVVAKGMLKPGDRVRATKCPGTERTFTFDHWDGHWMVSRSGIDDYSPMCITKINGEEIDIKKLASECGVDVSKKVKQHVERLSKRDENYEAAGVTPPVPF